MKHKSWFRLVLKAIGIVLIGLGIPEILRHGTQYVRWYFMAAAGRGSVPPWMPTWFDALLVLLPGLVQVALGLVVLLRTHWIADWIIPSNRPYCPECGYDLSMNDGEHCTECGVRLPEPLQREIAAQRNASHADSA